MELYKKQLLTLLEGFMFGTGESKNLENLNDLDEEQWNQVYGLASVQQIVPMIYQSHWKMAGLSGLSQEAKGALKYQVMMQNVQQVQKTSAFLEIYQKLSEQNLQCLVVKGILCRELYADPDSRPSNDEDLFIKKEDLVKCDEILLKNGFSRQSEDLDGDEIVYYNGRTGLMLEVHVDLFDPKEPAYGAMNDSFQNAFQRAKKFTVQGQEIWSLCETDHFLFLVFHALKHFLHGGVGIRQICDIVMAACAWCEQLDWEYIFEESRKYNADVFVINLLNIGVEYFQCSFEKYNISQQTVLTYKDKLDSEALLEDLLDAGIFGQSTDDRKHSATITLNSLRRAETGKKNTGILHSIFPGIREMEYKYHYLKKYPMALPIAWGQRICSYIFSKRRKTPTVSIQIGRKRIELLKKYNVIR